ncbi:PREDICTED: probable leucine-rich repeat receptor-like serine/threonine-protein kinase At3g14840 [Nelumbo nucifera]|nr:PREDICTED: probable leucine-rich repeat receptor-like serine/threonine-protein kinase At3g14840 [Nelumbo nucifera]
MVLGDSFVVWTIGFSCLLAFAFGATGTTLVPDEVNALGQIARRLGKTNWDFSVDPCSGQSGWKTLHPLKGSENAVTCNCSSDNTVCHVTSILLKSQGLPGVLPPELVKLPYLREIDFTRNYLNGTIPPEWGSTKLEIISLQANRLSGSIPKELGNITTLQQLVLDHNYFSGVLPPELGNLVNLQRLLLSSNNLTGQLPDRLSNLVSLKDFRVSDNKFSGKIPSTIGNWMKLKKLEMQASGFEGPIPSEISILENLTDIRISDINGPDTSFPSLGKMNLTTLMLKSCNIIGELPPYLAKMRQLTTLDLSFNKLSGQINSSFDSLSTVYYVILAANMLSGPVPLPMLETGRNIDLSYNNFTIGSSGVPDCQDQNVNLFRSSFRNSS